MTDNKDNSIGNQLRDNSVRSSFQSLVGQPAIDFSSRSTRGQVRLSDYRGQWVVLFCHPADFTPVCTSEFIALAKRHDEFESLGVQLIGLSVDSVYSHMGWVEWIEREHRINVRFPVVEDISMDIARAYGMIDDSSKTTATVRGCYFIDPAQTVQAMIHYPMHLGRSIDEIMRVQKALIATYQSSYTTPSDWQPGQSFMRTPVESLGERAEGWLLRGMRQDDPPTEK